MMILIDNAIVADEILSEHFHCNLQACKGQCCVEGVCGAPLEESEIAEIENALPFIKDDLSPQALQEIAIQGQFVRSEEHGLVTPTIGDGICVYGIKDKKGVVKCAFEHAYNEKKIAWKKPISCHLFPIRITQTKLHDMLNLEKIDICKSACSFGETKKIKAFEFLKEALTRKYGVAFYKAIEDISRKYDL